EGPIEMFEHPPRREHREQARKQEIQREARDQQDHAGLEDLLPRWTAGRSVGRLGGPLAVPVVFRHHAGAGGSDAPATWDPVCAAARGSSQTLRITTFSVAAIGSASSAPARPARLEPTRSEMTVVG